ncbi:MAG: hypothetical protein IH623_21440 [Verrucomicrobia bacterium]|nr:hypothetical protein [Verrucomicrobiota bacterium]
MNSIIETWNSWAEHLPGFVWPMLWQSSLLIAVVFALDLTLRRRVRAAVRYALWLIVLVKLVLPPSFSSPASLAYWVIPAQQLPPAPNPTPTYIVTYGNPTIAELPFPVHSVLPVAKPEVFRPTPTLRAWLLISWTVAGLWLAVILCRRTQRVRQRLTRAEAPADDLSVLLEKCRRQLRLRCPVRLRVSEDNTSPAVCGLFRPVILLPRQLTASLNQSQMRAVLLHELIHLKRGDVWVNCAQTLLQIFYWWHPLLWLANARIRRVREEAVDDAVMLALADDAETYAPTLLEVAKLAFNRPLTSLGLVGILESRSALRQRIERLMDFRPPRNAGLTMASALCVLAFAALAVPMGEPPPMTSSPSVSDSGSPHMESSNSQTATASHDTNSPHIDGAPSPSVPANEARPRSWYDAAIVYTNTERGYITKGSRNILEKLDRIRLPRVAYDRVSFTNVVRELIAQARTHDPAGRGVNFIVNPNVPPPISTVIDIVSMPITINPPLTNVRLGDALDAVVKATDKSIKYSIEDYGVVFSSSTVPEPERLPVFTFTVDANRFHTNLVRLGFLETLPPEQQQGPLADFSGSNFIQKVGTAFQSYLGSLGFDLNPEVWTNRAGALYIRATKQNRHAIGEALTTLFGAHDMSESMRPQSLGCSSEAAALVQTGKAFLEAGKLDEAEADLKKALSIDPNHIAAFYYLSLEKEARYLAAELGRTAFVDPLQAREPLHTRFFKVDTNTFLSNLRRTAGVTVTNNAELISSTLRKLLSDAGVELQLPKRWFFDLKHGMVVVRATPDALDRIEEVVQELNYAPPHIHIKAHFVELEPDDASRLLGFDWYPGNILLRGITATNASSQETLPWCRVLTNPQFRTVRHALEQREGVNLISSPEVTTLSGRQAQIQVADMRTVVSSTNGVMQTNTVPCGSVLDVLPTLGPDGYTIQITAIPSVTEFLGYDDPGPFVPKVPVAPSATGSSPAPVSVLPLPRFRVRQATKSAVLWDGQTLVIGGLSATNDMRLKDQVPVLGDLPLVGRLFRKETVGTQTNTLLVFVTARLVHPAGNPIHRDDQMPFKPDSIPPQLPAKSGQ